MYLSDYVYHFACGFLEDALSAFYWSDVMLTSIVTERRQRWHSHAGYLVQWASSQTRSAYHRNQISRDAARLLSKEIDLDGLNVFRDEGVRSLSAKICPTPPFKLR